MKKYLVGEAVPVAIIAHVVVWFLGLLVCGAMSTGGKTFAQALAGSFLAIELVVIAILAVLASLDRLFEEKRWFDNERR